MAKKIYGLGALLSLFVCLLVPFLLFMEKISESPYKTVFLIASVAWFVFATAWNIKNNPSES